MRDVSGRVLLTDGEERSVLAACRALRAAGYETTVVAATRPAVACWSRACGKCLSGFDPRPDPSGFASRLLRVLESEPHDVLLPGTDVSLLAVSEFRQRFAGTVRTGLPADDAVLRALDKTLLPPAAHEAGLEAPETVVCSSLDDGFEALRAIGAPAIVKPERTVVDTNGRRQERAGAVVADLTELSTVAERLGSRFLVQRLEPSAITCSLAGVAIRGRILAPVFSRYLRTWPAWGGAASLSVTVEPPPGLIERVSALVQTLGWEGIFELELLALPGERLAAIDFNPRVYGSMAVAIASGANLPAVWCDFLLGYDPLPGEARTGMVYRREDTELRHVVRALRSGGLRQATRILSPRPGAVHAFFRTDDPGPLLAQAGILARRAVAKAVGKFV